MLATLCVDKLFGFSEQKKFKGIETPFGVFHLGVEYLRDGVGDIRPPSDDDNNPVGAAGDPLWRVLPVGAGVHGGACG